MPVLRLVVSQHERMALDRLAARELRDPTRQAVLIIRAELQRLGLLPPVEQVGDASAPSGGADREQ